jgi:3-phosphoshikimate 1-carboxyvinyltransferase
LIHELEKPGAPIRAASPQTMSHAIDLDTHRLPLHSGICFETYSDHRMAMALAPLALRMGFLKIRNPDVVIKSYPDYWDHMRQLGFNLK